ncbi:recombinase family protein [Roseibacillus persicicus]|uniref:recombinase family protein n=1 Tax=Roseibacillus persicicus TaxID=454148 RepID=UPI00398B6CF6
MAAKTKVFFYGRFSNLEQKGGVSRDRQAEKAKAFARKHGYLFDTEIDFFDEGKSGFTGENHKSGALKEFIGLVREGTIPKGSILAVENLDRLTREKTFSAFSLLFQIVELGIEVVTLSDGERRINRETLDGNIGTLFESAISFGRGHEESATKSYRIGDAWRRKRDNNTRPLTKIAPLWLKPSNSKTPPFFEIIPERAALVQRMFDLSLKGWGYERIAKKFNEEQIPTWPNPRRKTKGWYGSYISKILNNRSVLGEMQPHEKKRGETRKPIGKPKKDYFPRIIEDSLFEKVSRLKSGRRNKGGRRGPVASNLFTHMATCGYCLAPMHFVNKGDGNHYLVCSNGLRGVSCGYHSWPYSDFESKVLTFIEEIDLTEIIGGEKNPRLTEIEVREDSLNDELGKLISSEKNIISQMEASDNVPKSVINRLYEIEQSKVEYERELFELGTEKAEIQHRENSLTEDRSEFLKLVSAEKEDAISRERIISKLKSLVSNFSLCPDGGFPTGVFQEIRDNVQEKPCEECGGYDMDMSCGGCAERLTAGERYESEFDYYLGLSERGKTRSFTITFLNKKIRTVFLSKRDPNFFEIGGSGLPSENSRLTETLGLDLNLID